VVDEKEAINFKSRLAGFTTDLRDCGDSPRVVVRLGFGFMRNERERGGQNEMIDLIY
jgi:hypothetical protein